MQLRSSFDIFLYYFLISISFLGLCFLPILTFNSTHTSNLIDTPLQRALVGLIFGGICLLGIIAAIYPSRCSQILHLGRSKNSPYYRSKNNIREEKMGIRGHHPTCNNFSEHIIRIGSKTYCAGCLGMIIGGVIVLLGGVFYFSAWLYLKEVALIIFWLGFFGVAIGFLHYTLFNLSGIIRFLFNILFVLGSFFLFIGIDMIANNLALDLFVLTLVIYWIIIRIIISQQRHQRICMLCNLKSCRYFG